MLWSFFLLFLEKEKIFRPKCRLWAQVTQWELVNKNPSPHFLFIRAPAAGAKSGNAAPPMATCQQMWGEREVCHVGETLVRDIPRATFFIFLIFFLFFLFFGGSIWFLNNLKNRLCVMRRVHDKYFYWMVKIEFHRLDKWWNVSFKIVKLLLTWQARVSKNWNSAGNALTIFTLCNGRLTTFPHQIK